MKVNGESIIITDPCYISHKEDWCSENGFDCLYEKVINPRLGFSDYLMESTGIGDGSWTVFESPKRESPKRLEELLHKIYENDEYEKNLIGNEVGEYAADSGMSGVFKLSEVEKYVPKHDIEELVESDCAVVIEDFIGEVETFRDESGELHFIGIGNKSFYTV